MIPPLKAFPSCKASTPPAITIPAGDAGYAGDVGDTGDVGSTKANAAPEAAAASPLNCSSSSEASSSHPAHPLLANNSRCCRICLDDDPHGLYSPCRCRGSIKRKSLMAHGRDESANSCTMCGFNYVLKKRARFYELISYRGIRIAITFLFVLAMLFPSGYVMKVCVLLSGYNDVPGNVPATYLQSLRDIPSNMDGMVIFPICKANGNKFSFGRPLPTVAQIDVSTTATASALSNNMGETKAETSGTAMISTPSHFISIFPGPYPHMPNSNMYNAGQHARGNTPSRESSSSSSTSDSNAHQSPDSSHVKQRSNAGSSPFEGSWARLAASIDIMGSSEFASMILYPFANDRLLYYLLCRLQHLHLGFFLLGSASNVYMACKMLSDMYDLIITPPHSRYIKNFFLVQTSIFVIWFWFSYNLMAFRVSTTEEEFMSELPLWALRWINVGVAIVDLSYRRVYNRLGRLKVEEELLDISDVEKVEERQQKAWLYQQQRLLQFGQEQGQYLLDQFMALEVKQSILNGANAAVDVVSDVYSKTSIPSFPPIPNSLASAVTMMSATSSSNGNIRQPEMCSDPPGDHLTRQSQDIVKEE
ncbi:hypothetical protein BGX21_000045 [Mortierella sp. AD011]|nr:hypothetical protein BGX21_000045 [Mortierella sp. AD011]